MDTDKLKHRQDDKNAKDDEEKNATDNPKGQNEDGMDKKYY